MNPTIKIIGRNTVNSTVTLCVGHKILGRNNIMKHKFDTFGVMLSVSGNAVMNVDAFRRFVTMLSKFGYNTLFLYMEDTYEIEGEPYFGYMRGRYSKEEMKELDDIADSVGIEIIPCIQTLGHLGITLGMWRKYPRESADILLVDDDETYRLIRRMLETTSECFRSRRVHLGMDEAHSLGKGAHLDKYGYEDPISIFARHLRKVDKIARECGYADTMIWSDPLICGWNGGAYGNDVILEAGKKAPREYIDALPSGVIPVYWDYYNTDEKVYSDMLDTHEQFCDRTWFAGGVWNWFGGYVPYNDFSIKSMVPALDACKKHKIKNAIMTMWGGKCSPFMCLPSLCYLAEYAKGNTDEEKIKAKFKRIVGIDFDKFRLIDTPNDIVGDERLSRHPRNPAFFMLCSDYLIDFLDYTVKPGAGVNFTKTGNEMRALAKSSRKYGYIFDTVAKLCDVLEIKYELGLRTRRAYEAGDKEELRRLANNEYKVLPKRIDAFIKALEKQWYLENKPIGFEVQEIQLGGLLRRAESVRRRLLAYCDGKEDKIEELEYELLPFEDNKNKHIIEKFTRLVTVNNYF